MEKEEKTPHLSKYAMKQLRLKEEAKREESEKQKCDEPIIETKQQPTNATTKQKKKKKEQTKDINQLMAYAVGRRAHLMHQREYVAKLKNRKNEIEIQISRIENAIKKTEETITKVDYEIERVKQQTK